MLVTRDRELQARRLGKPALLLLHQFTAPAPTPAPCLVNSSQVLLHKSTVLLVVVCWWQWSWFLLFGFVFCLKGKKLSALVTSLSLIYYEALI